MGYRLNKNKANSLVYFVVVLGLVCFISASLLSYVYAKTQPKIEDQKKKLEQESMYYVLPEAVRFERNDECDCYIGEDKHGNIVGYVFISSEKGYSSVIKLMVGVNKDYVIEGIKVLSQNETPGLGTKIVEVKSNTTVWDAIKGIKEQKDKNIPEFLKQFIGKDMATLIEVHTISGATISSSAVIRAVKKGMERLVGCLLKQEAKNGEKCSVCDK